MNAETGIESTAKKQPAVRLWLVALVLGLAIVVGWLAWPSAGEGIDPFSLSRQDGKSRFYTTSYPKLQTPPNLPLRDRLWWAWVEYRRRHGKPNPMRVTFPPTPVQPCSIHGLLNQCMEVSGTQYYIAVEVAGAVEFGHTNALNGAQWVAAFERAIEASKAVMCYDFANKRNFQDKVLLIRESPGVVKVVPQSKLPDYQRAGLVKSKR